jgi:uncharacterized protein YfaS (alpha-2-macroglobulin family)
MKKHLTTVLALGGFLVMTAAAFISHKTGTYLGDTTQPYEKLWKKVDSCQNKGPTESALKVIELIYQKAKSENNAPQLVKALLNRSKFENYREENSLQKTIERLEKEAAESKFPVTPVIRSIMAEAYWNYYQNNRWQIQQRSKLGVKGQDLATWDLSAITAACVKNYLASLQPADSLKSLKVDFYAPIIVPGNLDSRKLRPTLYDFLLHRAADFFKNSEAGVNRPAETFSLNNQAYLTWYKDFMAIELPANSDSFNLNYFALKLLQDAARFHSADTDPEALIDAELERLDWVWEKYNLDNKDSLYLAALDKLAEKFEAHPASAEILYSKASWYNLKAGSYKPLAGDSLKWHNKTAQELAAKALKKFPDSYGGKLCRQLLATISAKTLNCQAEQVNEPKAASRMLLKYKNISEVFFRVVKTTQKQNESLTREYYSEKLFAKYLAMQPVQSFSYKIPDDGDLNEHSIEVKVPELETGYYVILASTSSDFRLKGNIMSYFTMQVSNIAWQNQRLTNGDIEFIVSHRMSGKPLVKAKAVLWFDKYDYITRSYKKDKGPEYVTDENGMFTVKAGSFDNYRNFTVDFSYGEDVLHSAQSFYIYKYNETEYDTYRTFFFTDRAIYRPGQSIQFKLLHVSVHGKETKIQPGKTLHLQFRDVNYQEVARLEVTTNEYGTASGTFTAPQGVLNGQMSIVETYGNIYLRVEEYKRPTFEVTANPIEGTYKPNDEVIFTGRAMAYSGQAADGASVKYRVTRRAQLPYWYWWYRPWNNSGGEAEITNGTTTTNDTGGFVVKFKAIPDEKFSARDNVIFNYVVYADVTDINGETHSLQQTANVGYQGVYLEIEAEDKINKSEANKIRIHARNANSHPEKAQGTLKIFALKKPSRIFRERLWEQPDGQLYTRDEYYKIFPHDLYADELNQYKWERAEKVAEIQFSANDTAGIGLSALTRSENGIYMLEATTKDKSGMEVKDIKYVTTYLPGENELTPVNVPDWYEPVKAIAEPGEKTSFIMSSAHRDLSYFLQVERDKKIITRTYVPASMKAFEIAVSEEMRGNFVCHISFIRNNRYYYHQQLITVPYTNKELEVYTETFRNKLLPGQSEEWKVVIKNKKGEKETAELLASMYDASLDAFVPHYWGAAFFPSYYAHLYQQTDLEQLSQASTYYYGLNENYYPQLRQYDALNEYSALQGNAYYNGRYRTTRGARTAAKYAESEGDYAADEIMLEVAEKKLSKEEAQAAPVTTTAANAVGGYVSTGENLKNADKSGKDYYDGDDRTKGDGKSGGKEQGGEGVQMRKNFAETAFFYPQLQSNEKGEVTIKFTIPDAVTRWKFMTFAHTKDLKSGQLIKEVVTQKKIMVQVNAPRFFREGDRIFLPAKISNTSAENFSGTVTLSLLNAVSGEDITTRLLAGAAVQNFKVDKSKSAALAWELTVPEGVGAITYKVVAKAGSASDGEENTAPVLSNRMLVTESMPLPVRGNQTKDFSFEKLISQNGGSTTLRNHKLTLEFTSNPAWYAVQSLPYLMEYPYECAEQTFSRFYANTLASYIANSKPVIKKVFDSWKASSPEAFYSNLQKNQELKSLMLEETPWVLDAKDESESKRRVALLFDLNRMGNEMRAAQRKLLQLQVSNGGWPWFAGMRDDEFITLHIVSGFGHLDKLGAMKVRSDNQWWNALSRGIRYCDSRIDDEYDYIKKYHKNYKNEDHLSYNAIQYLYARSFYTDVNMSSGNKEAYNYFTAQAKKYWTAKGRYMQAMICLALFRQGDKATANDIIRSLKENALQSEEMGMYYKDNYAGYYWYEAPIEAQSLIIEAFTEVAADTKLADELRIWLLKSKQTQNWKSTKATCEAVYALLLQGTEWLATEPNVEITLGSTVVNPAKMPDMKVEAGTGYFKTSWSGNEVKPEMGKVKVVKQGKGISWGAVYWQYFENLDKITAHETNLKLNKKLYLQKNTASGPVLQEIKAGDALSVGDKLKVRIELRVDRDMQYVHMKDMRASGFEPVNVLSGYKWQDGLGYYQSTRDAATNFFFDHLNKGTYVFEYTLNVSHAGNFSNGITTIQCMYAPEFTSHSEGIRVAVKK